MCCWYDFLGVCLFVLFVFKIKFSKGDNQLEGDKCKWFGWLLMLAYLLTSLAANLTSFAIIKLGSSTLM